MRSPTETLFDTTGLRVFRVPYPSLICVMTFSSYADPLADEDGWPSARSGFAAEFLNRHKIDAVHIVTAQNDWFQSRAMHDAVLTIRKVVGGKKPCFTYGSSMGGYGAIRFAGALGAQRAIAISPQYALDRAVVPFETRWRAEAKSVHFLKWPEVATPPLVIAIFDPHNLDALHVERWVAERPVLRVALPYSGHPAGAYLAELGLLSRTVLDILSDRFDPVAFAREVRTRRRTSGRYYCSLSEAQPPWRRGLRLRLMRRAVLTASNSTQYTSQLAILLYRAGQDGEAEQFHRRAMRLSGNAPIFAFRYSLFLQRVGQFDRALAAARIAADGHPTSVAIQRHVCRLSLLAGPPNLVRSWLMLMNAGTHMLIRLAWRQQWADFGRLGQP